MYFAREMKLTLAATVTILAILVAGAYAGSVYVDDDADRPLYDGTAGEEYKRITDALADSSLGAGDIIYVAPGLYDVANNGEAFPLSMKDGVALRGSSSEMTTVDAGEAAGAIRCCYVAEGTIDGFTTTNGSAAEGGTIIRVNYTPAISNCDIIRNSASRSGAIHCDTSPSPAFSDCVIAQNYYWLVDIVTRGNWTAHGPVSTSLPLRPKLMDCQRSTGDH